MTASLSPHLHAKDPAACAGTNGSYPLACHSLDTALTIRAVWETRVPPRLKARVTEALASAGYNGDPVKIMMLVGALHDVGKANSWFQYQERETAPWVSGLAANLGLPNSEPNLASALRRDNQHPLRRHEFISFRAAAGQWPDDTLRVADAHWLAMIAAGHHGYWRPTTRVTGLSVAAAGDILLSGWSDQQKRLVAVAEEAVGLKVADVPAFTDRSGVPVFALTSGLLTLADWLASDDSQVRLGKAAFEASADSYCSSEWIASWMRDRDVVLRAHVAERLGPLGTATTDSWNEAVLTDRDTGTRFSPRPLQAEALAGVRGGDDDGLWIVMYPTGDGKTEAAALRHALQPQEGLIFGLPTRATTDAIEKRLNPWFNDAGAMLTKAHQFSGLDDQGSDDDDDSCCAANSEWYTASVRKLVSPNLVATCDQVLTGALAQRHIMFRLYGLATHHVVLDEVHTYDAYQTALLLELLTWWGATGTRVTLLSATLPTRHLAQMARAYRSGATGERTTDIEVPATAFPGTLFVPADPNRPLTAVDADPSTISRKPQPTVIEVTTSTDRDERVGAHVEWVLDQTTAHPDSPVAVVTNTIGDCSAAALALTADSATHEVVCLHSAMVAGHRTAAERTLHDRLGKAAHARGFDAQDPNRRPTIVVGTQVIQASLDFDVDLMSSDLAAAPDVIQRLGRQWRFETGAVATGERAARLGAGAHRRLHLVAVGETDEANDRLRITAPGAIPYLPSVLQRTLDWLVDRPEHAGNTPLDVFAHSQAWVDAAYDRLPDALLDSDDAADAQVREIVREMAMLREAVLSRADLSGVLLNGRRRRSWRSPTWKDLVEMTRLNEDEAVMRTRHIDMETQTVLLFDSTGRGHYFDHGSRVDLPAYPGASLADVAPSQASSLLRLAIPVPSSLRGHADTAINATLGVDDWRTAWTPKAKALGSIPPLDLAHLDGLARYSPLTGLTKEN